MWLELGKPVERKLQGGEAHSYRIRLEARQFLHMVVEQKGIHVSIALNGPDGKTAAESSGITGFVGFEPLSFIAETPGEYRVTVRCDNQASTRGKYQIRILELRMSIPEDQKRISAERLLKEGAQFSYLRQADSLKKAIAKWQEALPLWQALGDRYEEEVTLESLASVYGLTRDMQKALECLDQALLIARGLGDRVGEAATMTGMAMVYDSLGEKQKALGYFERSLPIEREVGDRAGEAVTLNGLATLHAALGERQKALDYFGQSVALLHTLGATALEAVALSNIGVVYDQIGEKQKALEYYDEALPLFRSAADSRGAAITLANIAKVYSNLGEKQKALEYYDQALKLQQAAGELAGQAVTLSNMAVAYSNLGQNQKALGLYEQALVLRRVVGDRTGEANTLSNMGVLYDTLGEKQKALDYYNQALVLQRAVNDPVGEATTLSNLGKTYSDLGQFERAGYYYDQALPLRRAVKDLVGEAVTDSNIATVFSQLGDDHKALTYYNQALLLQRSTRDKQGEAVTLNNMAVSYAHLGQEKEALNSYMQALRLAEEVADPLAAGHVFGNLMDYWKKSSNLSLSAYFGKQAVNSFQQIRQNISGLEQDTQRSFLHSKQDIYRELAEVLISDGRLFEAQQVLGLLKVQEFLDFTKATRGEAPSATASVALTKTEAEYEKRYLEVSEETTGRAREWDELSSNFSRTPEQEKRFQELTTQIDAANRKLREFFEDLYAAYGKTSQADKEQKELQQNASDMQSILQKLEPGTVAIYTLVAPERVFLLVVTPDVQVARQYSIPDQELRSKVFRFWKKLRSEEDAVPQAQELYRILLGPIQKDLDAYQAKTLMWSLDDVLRYIPMSALHDGTNYVVEKYRSENFTQASVSKLKDDVNVRSWQALAMGVSESHGGLPPLPAVPNELRSLVRSEGSAQPGLLPGRLLLDQSFTQEDMIRSLQLRFPVVHIASHFSFQPGDEADSFLLLGGKGQGNEAEILSLSQIRTNPNIRFRDTELLTLSACNTATSGSARGREVDGLSDIVQLKGARAVLASLWEVDDESTGILMRRFYEVWTHRPGTPKAEALRQAQLALLHGELRTATDKSKDNAYASPHYWAPFVLFGNWR